MTNDKVRILDHTTTVASEELVPDGYGEMSPKTFTVEGIVFTFEGDAGYVNREQGISLYLEGTDDGSEFWYAQTDPIPE